MESIHDHSCTGSQSSFRNCILNDLISRNKFQTKCFEELIISNTRLFEQTDLLKEQNLQLSVQIEKSNQCQIDRNNSTEVKLYEKVQNLEKKLFQQQEELTQLHKKRSENSQIILDANRKLQETEREFQAKNAQINALQEENSMLKSRIVRYEKSLNDLDETNTRLMDEYRALELVNATLNKKLREHADDNRIIQDKLMKYKNAEIERMNQENESFFKKPIRRDLTAHSSLGSSNRIKPNLNVISEVPRQIFLQFDAHDSEINAVKWSPSSPQQLATGGTDRKIKLWDIAPNGTYKLKKILDGSNAAIMSIDFDSCSNYLLGASSDFACRMWVSPEWQLKKTYTGHSGKVLAAKFLSDLTKIITGSYDRTLKLWDMNTITCIQTKFTGSSCNDLVITDSSGSTVISGHFDKKIRLWDTRAENCTKDLHLPDKITSLDLSKDFNYLLCCVRDDTLKIIDLRTQQIITTFSYDDFKIGCDWNRTVFSPDGRYVSAGSSNGAVFIWNVLSSELEANLRKHNAAVTAVSWQPCGKYLASVDRMKRVNLWSDS